MWRQSILSRHAFPGFFISQRIQQWPCPDCVFSRARQGWSIHDTGEVLVNGHTKIVIFLTLLALPFVAPPAQAHWVLDGSPVSEAAYTQDYCQAISDGEGGMIVTWQDTRNAYQGIYAQKIDGYGNQVWTTDGVAICAFDANQSVPFLCSDGAGGAIIVWEDYRNNNWDIYAQKIDAAGITQWADNGIAICNNPGYQDQPRLVPDGSGGAVIVWADDRNGNWDIYVQSVSSDGLLGPGWFTGGLPVCDNADNQFYPDDHKGRSRRYDRRLARRPYRSPEHLRADARRGQQPALDG